MTMTLDFIVHKFAGRMDGSGLDDSVHFLISIHLVFWADYSMDRKSSKALYNLFAIKGEDGRGLAGGNWMVRNSPQAIRFLEDVYGEDDETVHAKEIDRFFHSMVVSLLVTDSRKSCVAPLSEKSLPAPRFAGPVFLLVAFGA